MKTVPKKKKKIVGRKYNQTSILKCIHRSQKYGLKF